jgi:hypothetical protein
MNNITYCTINGSSKITGKAFENLHNITELSIIYSPNITDDNLKHLKLNKLYLANTSITSQAINNRILQKLTIDGNEKISNDTIENLSVNELIIKNNDILKPESVIKCNPKQFIAQNCKLFDDYVNYNTCENVFIDNKNIPNPNWKITKNTYCMCGSG